MNKNMSFSVCVTVRNERSLPKFPGEKNTTFISTLNTEASGLFEMLICFCQAGKRQTSNGSIFPPVTSLRLS